jgi:hypothetical protein
MHEHIKFVIKCSNDMSHKIAKRWELSFSSAKSQKKIMKKIHNIQVLKIENCNFPYIIVFVVHPIFSIFHRSIQLFGNVWLKFWNSSSFHQRFHLTNSHKILLNFADFFALKTASRWIKKSNLNWFDIWNVNIFFN